MFVISSLFRTLVVDSLSCFLSLCESVCVCVCVCVCVYSCVSLLNKKKRKILNLLKFWYFDFYEIPPRPILSITTEQQFSKLWFLFLHTRVLL